MTQHQKTCEYPGCSETYLTVAPGRSKWCPEHADMLRNERNKERTRKLREKRRGYVPGQTVEEQINAKLSKKHAKQLAKKQALSKV